MPLALLLCAALSAPLSVAADEDRDPYRILDDAKQAAGSIPKQADALARYAWPDGERWPELNALARAQLVGYGADALPALRAALRRVAPPLQADVVAAVLETRELVRSKLPSDLLPTLEDALWYGTAEAKRLAIPELTEQRFPLAMLDMIDAAYEFPELAPQVIEALGRFGSDRARHYLLEVLNTGKTEERHLAARSLARIGDRALRALRDAARSADPTVRSVAVAELLPISTVDDLTLLYELVALGDAVDEDLRQRVIARTQQLEILLERQLSADAATSD